MDFGKRQKKQRAMERALSSNMTLAFLILLVALLGNATWNVYRKYTDAQIKERRAKEELSALITRSTILEHDINRLNTETGREEEIRKRFGLGKEGERMIVINDEEKKDTTGTTHKTSWLSDMWEKMFGWK